MSNHQHPRTGLSNRTCTSWCLGAALVLAGLAGCGGQHSSPATDISPSNSFVTTSPVQYTLNAEASGISEIVNNIANITVVSNDSNDLVAEYQAGFVQGHIQGKTILSARDNALTFWAGGDPSFISAMNPVLVANFDYTMGYLQANTAGTAATQRLKRLVFRMLGIYHGATLSKPASLDFSGTWLPTSSTFQPSELALGYQAPSLSFMDLYFINSFMDVADVLYYGVDLGVSQAAIRAARPTRNPHLPWNCSAFVRRTADDVIITHSTWDGYLSQTMSMTINVNGDMMTVNSVSPGQIGSVTDFGYNNKGLMFNETTHSYAYTEAKQNAVWIVWRAALAEQFSSTIDDFMENISLDNSGTYLNGYMLVDAKTQETGLVDMSYKTFVLFRSTGGAYTYTTKPAGLSTDYDSTMLTPDYIMGYNYPVSTLVRDELQSSYDSPRRSQFQQFLPGVKDLDSAKTVITYNDPMTPDSIFGRFDSGKYAMPFGAVDATVANTGMAQDFMKLTGALDLNATAKGFWMLYGTAHINGEPFIWSKSQWSAWSHPDVPDVVDGTFTNLNLHLK